MTTRDLIVIAAVAAFSLAGIASVNDSESINVTLPSQYRMVWDQSPDLNGVEAAEVAHPTVRVSVKTSRRDHAGFGPFARNVSRRGADRG